MRYLFFLLLLTACGKSNTTAYTGPSNILRNWSGFSENPSFSGLALNQSHSTNRFILCDGRYFDPSNPSDSQPYNSSQSSYGAYTPYNYPYDNYQNYPYSQTNYNLNQTNTSSLSGAARSQFTIQAQNENEGSIYMGELLYLGARNPTCMLFSNKILSYEVAGNKLIICLPSPNQNICFDYSESY